MKVTELLHTITQRGYQVSFQDDFEGMLTVTYQESYTPGKKDPYIRHEHVSYPGGSMKELEKALVRSLGLFVEEIKNGDKPKKDGLASKD